MHPLFVLENACAALELSLENSSAGIMMFVLENSCGANMHADAPRKKKENLSEKFLVKGFPYRIIMLICFIGLVYILIVTLHERV